MNREDTIKDIAQYVCGACELDMTCKRDYGEFTYTCCDNALSPAVKIYEAGYRKTFTSDTQKAFKEGYKKGCETCAQAWANGYNYGYKSGKDDGVKEFAEKLKAKTMCIKEYEDGTRILQTSNKLIDQSVKIFLDELLKEYEK